MACCRRCTTSNLPKPRDERVRIRQLPQCQVAVVRFSGTWTTRRFESFLAALLEAVQRSGLQTVRETWSARYDPPWTPWFLRRNEIMIEVQPRTDIGMLKIGEASPGGAGRDRTSELTNLMARDVPIPSLATEKDFDRLQFDVAALKDQHAAIRQANSALIPATLERIFSTEAPARA